jgi:hypothetical protein
LNADITALLAWGRGEKSLDDARSTLYSSIVNASVPRGDDGLPVDNSRTRGIFARVMTAVLRNSGTEAYLSGMRDAGIARPMLTPADRDIINGWLAAQVQYVESFVDAVFSDTYGLNDASREYHADMWANKSLYIIYTEGLKQGGAFKRYVWRVGATEHCPTCLMLSGQVHTIREWERSKYLPKSDILECGGFNCQCILEPTDEPVRGVLP